MKFLKMLCCGAALGMAPAAAYASPFTAGDIVVDRIGTGAAALSSAAQATFLDEYTPSGVLVQSIAMPTANAGPQFALTNSGTATSEGALNLSADGSYLWLGGYGAAPGTASIAGTTAAAAQRVAGRVDALGNVDTSTTFGTAASGLSFNANNIRSVTSTDGGGAWAAGPGGINYTTFGSTVAGTAILSPVVNSRVDSIYNGQLYATSATSPNIGVNSIGSGVPIVSTTATAIPGLDGTPGTSTATNSPYAFVIVQTPAGTVGYVADDDNNGTGGGSGGIQKFALIGSTWTPEGKIGAGTDQYRGLTAAVVGNNVQLYATKASGGAVGSSSLVGVLDTTGQGDFSALGFNLNISNVAANEVWRGVAFAPTVPEPSSVVLAGLGVAGLALAAVRRRRAKSAGKVS